MSNPASGSPVRATEPGGFTLFVLFFGSLVVAGLIGIWLWNSNPSVQAGKALGTPNQVAAGGAAPAAAGGAADSGQLDAALVAKGQTLAAELGCRGCHSVDGTTSAGPTWKGLAGSERQLDNGQKTTADDVYLRESIQQPDAKIVRGFTKGLMAGGIAAHQTELQNPENIAALVTYIKSLK